MSNNPLSGLNDENQEQIRKYLKFFRLKREGIVRGLQADFNDAKNDRLSDDMFSKEDMLDYSDFISSSVLGRVREELTSTINMNVLLISRLLEGAQDSNVSLDLDASAVENQVLIQTIEKMNIDAMPKGGRKAVDALPSFKEDAKAVREEAKAIKDEADRLAGSNKVLQERFTALQADATKLTREKNALQTEVSELRRKLESGSKQRSESSSKADSDSNYRISSLEQELRQAKEDLAKRFTESTQYTQMVDIMKKKTKDIINLRKRLERYEPDDTKNEDDDDEEDF